MDAGWLHDLKKIKVPIVPLGVGTTVHRGQSVNFDKQSQYLLELIHSSCNEASVRDPVTYELMRKSGINNVRMTGCPTLYSSLKANWQLNAKQSKQVVVTVRKGQNRNVKHVISELSGHSMELTIAAQKKQDLYCARGKFPFISKKTDYLYEFNLQPYQDMVANSYGAIGWRLHGNMFHLAAGNPVRFFANCSRVKSFCEAFNLPYIYAEDGESIAKQDLANAVDMFLHDHDYSRFAERYAFYFKEMKDFLANNNIASNLWNSSLFIPAEIDEKDKSSAAADRVSVDVADLPEQIVKAFPKAHYEFVSGYLIKRPDDKVHDGVAETSVCLDFDKKALKGLRLRLLWRLYKFLKKENFDVIICH